ncbi:uncharacterized protein LOC112576889 isoform X1 [Pomacea canaliculata]|nr:uncharacterized protein LOC112576889 isoform X1 [Pomacea canaliculata]XP_025115499.1 uncharacterized protein LOC112576889 isoform X1 [Pomacea canaliculata]XP_025115500.1 uncharacterized protein LOC112576889 isoform X1 [Pomacea canaliculata]XP_025115501.1 uncharacterized protein LOC112576889 isoform X1 [Pomacea canaliculata]XP_025115502.1 uncharacterized protein LOC112576889 isoform X1 [Pomacea canaliculata]XP_025115503.1 uncharacterized protein LOC112576889 isoform X1 [Pomacea canaliculata]
MGHVIQPPLSWNVVDPVRLKPLFIITVRDNECVVLCRQGCSAQIKILLAWLEEESESLRGNFDQRMLRHLLQGNVSFLHRIYNLAEQTRYCYTWYIQGDLWFSWAGVHTNHSEDGYTLLGNKLTGDPNVPAGETSLYIDLRQPIRLTTDEQRNIDILKSVTAPILPHPFLFDPSEVQPFFLCTDLLEREAPGDLPRTCKAR